MGINEFPFSVMLQPQNSIASQCYVPRVERMIKKENRLCVLLVTHSKEKNKTEAVWN
jgi:hypothetical protein